MVLEHDAHVFEDGPGIRMTSPTESEALAPTEVTGSSTQSWAKVGIAAAASALVGGLAAAWWYRKTLKTLRQTEEINQNSKFGISTDEADPGS
jgi:hypothetical protein